MSEKTKLSNRTIGARAPAARAAVLSLASPLPAEGLPTRWEESVAVVAVRGELDRDGIWGIDYSLSRAECDAGLIVLDLCEVTHIDYAGVPTLLARSRELRARGGELRIAARSPYVINILRAAGGAELTIFRSVDEASLARAAQVVACARARGG